MSNKITGQEYPLSENSRAEQAFFQEIIKYMFGRDRFPYK